MDTQLYLRVRGRVLGPYDPEKLQELVRRGQLSRMHEVSVDGTHWVRASTYAELFIAVPVKLVAAEMQVAAAPPAQAPRDSSAIPLAEPTCVLSGPHPLRVPRCRAAGNGTTSTSAQQGPLDESGLRQMLATGQLDADALVWNESMAQWAAASQIPGLARRGGSGAQASELELECLCKAARASRPWVMFLAITAFVYAVLCILGGFLQLVFGANRGIPFLVASGVFGIVAGILATAGGILLISYASRLASLAYSHSTKVLESAMERLKIFWLFVSIVLIVALAFFAFFAILVFADVVSLPHYM